MGLFDRFKKTEKTPETAPKGKSYVLGYAPEAESGEDRFFRALNAEETMNERRAAIRALGDQELLYRIVGDGFYETDRTAALERLTQQDYLYDTALHNSVYKLRALALKRLDDSHREKLLYSNAPNADKACAAAAISDVPALKRVIRDVSLSQEVRMSAARHLELTAPEEYGELRDLAEDMANASVQRKADSVSAPAKKQTILDQYRAGLSFLDSCGSFDEEKLREFNRITGKRFSEENIRNYVQASKDLITGMEGIRQTLRGSMKEAIGTFEQLEKNGIDLSKFDI